jgi:hypothetical protein
MLEPMFRSMRAFWLANAEARAGGSTLELPHGDLDLVEQPSPRDFDASVQLVGTMPDARRLGYRDHGRVQMWERRKPAPPG